MELQDLCLTAPPVRLNQVRFSDQIRLWKMMKVIKKKWWRGFPFVLWTPHVMSHLRAAGGASWWPRPGSSLWNRWCVHCKSVKKDFIFYRCVINTNITKLACWLVQRMRCDKYPVLPVKSGDDVSRPMMMMMRGGCSRLCWAKRVFITTCRWCRRGRPGPWRRKTSTPECPPWSRWKAEKKRAQTAAVGRSEQIGKRSGGTRLEATPIYY